MKDPQSIHFDIQHMATGSYSSIQHGVCLQQDATLCIKSELVHVLGLNNTVHTWIVLE